MARILRCDIVWVNASQIRTPSVERLGRKIGRVSPDELDQLIDGLTEVGAAERR